MDDTDTNCKTHPDAPHGFMRDASHSAGRYVCDCESWEEPKQQPVGYVSGFDNGHCVIQPTDPAVVLPVGMALYRAPTEWVGLTDEEKEKLVEAFYGTDIQRLEAVEAKLKEKNK